MLPLCFVYFRSAGLRAGSFKVCTWQAPAEHRWLFPGRYGRNWSEEKEPARRPALRNTNDSLGVRL